MSKLRVLILIFSMLGFSYSYSENLFPFSRMIGLAPQGRVEKIDLFEQPSRHSKKVGELRIQAQGAVLTFHPMKGEVQTFKPDVISEGKPIHTVLQRKGRWVQLPKRPFKEPVWLEITSEWGDTQPSGNQIKVKTSKLSGWVHIEKEKNGILTVLKISRPDGLCEAAVCEGPQFPISKKRYQLLISDLIDSDGHILVDFPYGHEPPF